MIRSIDIPPNSTGKWTHVWNDKSLPDLPMPVRAYGADGTEVLPPSFALNVNCGCFAYFKKDANGEFILNLATGELQSEIGHVPAPITFGPY